jgi:hypothetical protein
MSITINGNGTISGVSVGGLPNGIVDTDTLAAGAVTAAKRGVGAVLQVKSATKTDATSISSSGGNIYDVAGLSVDITAAATGNKMLIIAMVACSSHSSGMGTLLRKDSTSIFLGDAASSRGRLTTNVENQSNSVDCKVVPITFLDTAADTNSHTYKISVNETDAATNTFYINRGSSDSDQANRSRVVSSITVMEIAA